MDDAKLAAIVDAIVRELQSNLERSQKRSVRLRVTSDVSPASVSQALSPSSVVPVKSAPATSGGEPQH